MANAKRVMDAARTLQLEICADAAIAAGPFVAAVRERDRGAEVLARAIEEGAIPPDLLSDIANAVGRAITAVIGLDKIHDRLICSVDAYLTDSISSDEERKKAASALRHLVSIALQQAIGLGADIAMRAHLDGELVRRMPRESHLAAARSRKMQRDRRRAQADERGAAPEAYLGELDFVGDPVRELINRHLNYRLRDPRAPLMGQRLKLGPAHPPFFETADSAEVGTPALNEQQPAEQPAYARVEGGRVQTVREVMLSTLAKKR
ncbi:protein of unknown function [Beijerinckiaceae bacterium RH AL1]|nr:hypothetical protein [Beijerinckiaceae bacterium]VVB42660.1 protein of unknown function [Beijerinckiaceae bacterium RH AL8]VVB42667.1 protein of unknown function [Beijerinckiaceae bacterium RH CH11]VVC53433.1 protein of unknown function [Beijerinckiaceae bacterium RH AL1]